MELKTLSGSHKTKSSALPRPNEYRTRLLETCWLSANTFELRLARPEGFAFRAGQHIRLRSEGLERDYSLTSGPEESPLTLLIRRVPEGALTPYLVSLEPGSEIEFSGPRGHFAFRPSDRPAVFVATGTGVAPFSAMVRSGVRGFLLLHGVREPEDLYYEGLFQSAAAEVVTCLTGRGGGERCRSDVFPGRVTACCKRFVLLPQKAGL